MFKGIFLVAVVLIGPLAHAFLLNSHQPSHQTSQRDDGGDDDGSSSSRHYTSSSGCSRCSCDEYKELMKLENEYQCMDENKVYTKLDALFSKSEACGRRIISHFAHANSNVKSTPCHCTGYNRFHSFHPSNGESLNSCYPDWHFDSVYNRFYYHFGSILAPSCRSHHAMWSELNSIKAQTSDSSCQQILVEHLGDLFRTQNHCSCSGGRQVTSSIESVSRDFSPVTTTVKTQPMVHHTNPPTDPPTTDPPSPATTRKSSLATSSKPFKVSAKYQCGKLSTVEGIALQYHVTEQKAVNCSAGNKNGSDESFVLINCNTPAPSQWKQGVKVLQHCSEIPTYTPIATFIGGMYYPSLAESGVFMGCIQGGFKLGVQHCNSVPTIDHVLTSASGLQNADYYHVIN